MIRPTRRIVAAGLVGAGLPLVAARGQALSQRPITIIVPFTPGTGIDILARSVGEQLRQRWGQPVVVENRPGASGNIGTTAAARAAPDGHTLLMTVNTLVMNASLFKAVPYDPVRSFAPVIEVAKGSLALAVHPGVAATSVGELVALAKARPGALNYGSPGVGTPQHLSMELFKQIAAVDLVHVPYKGSAGAVQDLTGGHVEAMFLPLHTALPLQQGGQIRVLAMGGERRAAVAPGVPTLDEAGVPGFEVDLWYGLMLPAGTPDEIVRRYNGTVNEILSGEEIRRAFAAQGLTPIGGTPEAFGDLVAKDAQRWARVIREARITAE